MDETQDFIIKNKPVTLKICLATLITSLALTVMFILFIVIYGVFEKVAGIWAVLVLPAVALAASCFGIFTYYKEAFIFKDGVFTCIKVFKKPQSVKAATIDFVIFRKTGLVTKVQFINKKAQIALNFLDDGTALQDERFLNALNELNIKVRNY